MKSVDNQESDTKRITLFDLDGTLIKGQSQQYMLKLLLKEHLLSIGSYITLVGWFFLYHIHIVRDVKKVAKYSYSLFAGIKLQSIESVLEKHRTSLMGRIYSQSSSLIDYETSISSQVVLVSASVEPIVKFYASHFGIDSYVCTKLVSKVGIITGKIDGKHVYGIEKVRTIKSLLDVTDQSLAHIVCYSDHYSDIDLMNYSDEPICVNPDRKLKQLALKNNWNILIFNI